MIFFCSFRAGVLITFIWHTAGDMQKFFPGGRAYYRAGVLLLPGRVCSRLPGVMRRASDTCTAFFMTGTAVIDTTIVPKNRYIQGGNNQWILTKNSYKYRKNMRT